MATITTVLSILLTFFFAYAVCSIFFKDVWSNAKAIFVLSTVFGILCAILLTVTAKGFIG